MQIYEVNNNTAEILYAPSENNLLLSNFIYIEDSVSTIVAQIMNISSTENEDYNLASVRFQLSVDKENRLTRYNGHTPAKNASVGFINAKEIIELFGASYNKIFWGKYLQCAQTDVYTNLKFLSSGCCVICDKNEQKNIIVKTISDSLKENNAKFVIMDFEGYYKNISGENSVLYGDNYKIPLDSVALDYIFENDLNDCPIDAKVIIQGIILEIQKYTDNCQDGFIPFDTFVNIIKGEASSSKNTGLMIFCNKLLKYQQRKVFANKKEDFSIIKNLKNSIKIDFSKTDEKHYPLIFKSIIQMLSDKVYIISDITEENFNQNLLKYIYEKQNIRLIPIINHNNYLVDKIKAHCCNNVLFNPETKKDTDEDYFPLLKNLNKDEFLLYGANTLYVPIAVSLKDLFRQIQNEDFSNDDITLSDLDDLDAINLSAAKKMLENEKLNQITEEDLDILDSQSAHRVDIIQKNIVQNKEQPNKNFNDTKEKTNTVSVVKNQDFEEKKAELEKLFPKEAYDEPIPNLSIDKIQKSQNVSDEKDATENNDVLTQETEDTQEDIKTEINPEKEEIQPQINAPEQQIEEKKQEKPSVSKQAAQPAANKTEQTIQKQTKKVPNPDELKVYEPKEPPRQIEVTFLEGDRVSHAKYGNGIVEKVMKYGQKTLCSIQFDNVGRRLLDPNITVIEKI